MRSLISSSHTSWLNINNVFSILVATDKDSIKYLRWGWLMMTWQHCVTHLRYVILLWTWIVITEVTVDMLPNLSMFNISCLIFNSAMFLLIFWIFSYSRLVLWVSGVLKLNFVLCLIILLVSLWTQLTCLHPHVCCVYLQPSCQVLFHYFEISLQYLLQVSFPVLLIVPQY